MKTLDNVCAVGGKGTRDQVPDVQIWGDGDMFKLLCKASSKAEGWMKSTKAMRVFGGCLVQVTTQQCDNVAEALAFVRGVEIEDVTDDKGNLTGRRLVPIGDPCADTEAADD